MFYIISVPPSLKYVKMLFVIIDQEIFHKKKPNKTSNLHSCFFYNFKVEPKLADSKLIAFFSAKLLKL